MTYVYLHRILVSTFIGDLDGMVVDHIDGDRFNNDLSNLRICTPTQNLWNSRKREDSSSNFKGVYFHKNLGKWVARIQVDRKNRHLGVFVTELEAAKAYEDVAKEIHGEFFRSAMF